MTTETIVNWGGQKIRLRWHAAKKISEAEKVTSVHGYCFYEGKVALVHVEGRGFNVPGGHVENGETAEEALHREMLEEAYVTGAAQYIGAVEVDHTDNPDFLEGGPYPKIGYQLFYRVDIRECLPFLRENETLSRIWVEPEELPYVMDDHELGLLILEESLNTEPIK
ncbi:NUDIX domain-containing protein [Planococcus shixiaomingii]|uniref:NUDIX domain-containing protein n=1 Tax=Planococcus shixiaomingii TaxID=3058393 RepID=UPI00260AEF55|nr:NUDIX domain-containing protein [Planococcus sp. N022]WKA55728.1 NUDIX domain-containing protein [Planococcus sp. N022]